MATTRKKFIKAKAIRAKVHLPKASGRGKKEVELIITVPEDVARNLYRRLRTRFSGEK
jgi:hypothetical protein